MTGPAELATPVNHVLPAWDVACGIYAALAVTAALRHRDATGEGARISIPLENVALATAGNLSFLTEVMVNGTGRERIGNSVYGQYGQDFTSSDGASFMVVALTGRHFRDLTEVTGTTKAVAALAEALGADFTDEGHRYRHRDALTGLFTVWFSEHTAAEIGAALSATSVLWERYRTFADVVTDDRVTANPLFTRLDQPRIGEYLAPGLPMSIDGVYPPAVAAPALGDDTAAVLARLAGDESGRHRSAHRIRNGGNHFRRCAARMSTLLELLDLQPGSAADTWIGPGNGPAGKRAFGGQFTAQSLAAACRTVDPGRLPTNMHLQFLRGGDAPEPVEYTVARVFDGRTAAARRVDSRQNGRLLTTATVSFAADAGRSRTRSRADDAHPSQHAAAHRTGRSGAVDAVGRTRHPDRRRRVERRVRAATLVAGNGSRARGSAGPHADRVYVTDVYMIDPALQVHGHSMRARTHRSGTTDSSIWFHQPVRADQWNLLESPSPAAARGRGVVTASLIRADGVIAATLVQEGLIAEREPRALTSPKPTFGRESARAVLQNVGLGTLLPGWRQRRERPLRAAANPPAQHRHQLGKQHACRRAKQ